MTAGCPDPVTLAADACAGPFDLPPLAGGRADWRGLLEEHLYGPVPPPPEALEITRRAMPQTGAHHLTLRITAGGGTMSVDAALWLPDGVSACTPVICGLDFVGPAGILPCDSFPLDSRAVVLPRPQYGAADGRLCSALRGTQAHQWPVALLRQAGFGALVSCYGSWVPDCPARCADHGLMPLLGARQSGAISLWAWALMRLVDVAAPLAGPVWVAGHSRLGKAALWAAANDDRIAGVFANQSGAGGAAPAAHPVGETLAQMAHRFPHWLRPDREYDRALPCDQHHLLACIAPRPTYLACAMDDLWADPVGTYALVQQQGGAAWPPVRTLAAGGAARICHGPLGYHLRAGGHDLLPIDWSGFLDFARSVAD